MKKILCLLSLIHFLGFSQNPKLPFKDGESCSYRIGYGLFGGGQAKYSVIQDKAETKVIVSGRSNSFVDLFFIVRNRYETIINNRTLLPRYFKRNNNEGGYLINQEYFFNQDLNIVNTQNGKFKTNINTFDMLSSFLYGRSLKSTDLKKNESIYINMFLDEEIYNMEVIFLGKETINTDIGNIKCLKFSPKVQVGRVFKNEDDLTIWVSDDKNHLLIKVELEIWVGSIDAIITSAKNIKFPLSITD
tara:strand:+ start:14667 stop:15404 length:738 start_codon:yes stop_codon:yes gene_type:complete